MQISKEDFLSVAADLKMPKELTESFWKNLEKQDAFSNSTPFAKYLFYFGAMIIISAMTWFMTISWDWFGSGGVLCIALGYALFFASVGAFCWNKQGLRIPAGLLITIAVCMVPLIIYCFEDYLNIWPKDNPGKYQDFFQWVKGSWIFMEIGTIAAGLTALYFFPFPFIVVPVFFAGWLLSADVLPFLMGNEPSLVQRHWASIAFGFVLIAIAFVLDRKHREEYGFWTYLFGVIAFWIGLSFWVLDQGEVALFIYLLISVVMMCLSILLRRNIFMIAGAIGVFAYLSHLAYNVFKDSLLFPFALCFIGLVIIYLGVLYQKNLGRIEKSLLEKLPTKIQSLLGFEKNN